MTLGGKKIKNVERHLLTYTSFDTKEIKPVNLKGKQPRILIGSTDAEAEVPVFWSSDVNSRLIGKVPDRERLRAEGEEGIRG